MLSHPWQNIIHRTLGNQCSLCKFPLLPTQKANPIHWCERCFAYLSPIQRCVRCGLAVHDIDSSQPRVTCGTCLQDPPPWHRLIPLGDYDFPLSDEIKRFKDHGQIWHVNAMTQLLAQRIEQPAPLITCVPLHWHRYLKRGFNQSHVLARYAATHLNVEFDGSVFKRVLPSPSQRGNKKSMREKNLRGAFHLRKSVQHSHIAIVDDVVTTGSTVRQLCNLLLDVGVESIDIYCLCRTPVPRTR